MTFSCALAKNSQAHWPENAGNGGWDLGETRGAACRRGTTNTHENTMLGVGGKFWVESFLCWPEPNPLVRYGRFTVHRQVDHPHYAHSSRIFRVRSFPYSVRLDHSSIMMPQLMSYASCAIKDIILILAVSQDDYPDELYHHHVCIPSLLDVHKPHSRRQRTAKHAAQTLK